ncbi:DNRLRE domain-containing protein [Maribacter sp. 2304DJ31-5]|uniref:CBM96 family carbohydrate-binding protein n=1 Tax=Maribacter sp. 2304DJ31-5 TaxID=3386273 RepID=UPI0039BD40A9
MKQQTTINFFTITILALLLTTVAQAQDLPMVKHVDDLPFYVPPRIFPDDGDSQDLINYPGTDYPGSTQMAFDSQNRPYLYNERTKKYAGKIQTLRNGIWKEIDFTAYVNDVLTDQYGAPNGFDYRPDLYSHAVSSMHIDDENSLYLVLIIHDAVHLPDENPTTAGNYILLYSPDITVTNPTFTTYKIANSSKSFTGFVEVKTGYNDTSVPPAIGVYNDDGIDLPCPGCSYKKLVSFELYVPTKDANKNLILGDRILLDDKAVGLLTHSGGRAWAASKNGKIFVGWQSGVLPNTTTGANAYWIAEVDRSTRQLEKKYLGIGEGFAPPSIPPDNHNFATVSIDAQGYLHYIKGSHGPGQSIDFQYGRSPNPYSINGNWTFHDWESSDATYNSTVVTTNNKIISTARRKWQWMAFSTKPTTNGNNDWTEWKSVFSTDLPFGNQSGGTLYNAPTQREVVDKNGDVYYLACLRNFDFATEKEYFMPQTTVSFTADVDSVRVITRHDYLKRIINGKSVQKITFEPSDGSLSTSPVTLNATTNASGLPIIYEVISGPATVNGNLLTLTGIGEVMVKAKNSGNSVYYGDETVSIVQITDGSQIFAEADAYVRSGSYGNDNYGNSSPLIIKASNVGDSYAREAYYRFDLSSISGTITNAKLKLVPSGSSTNVEEANIDVKFVSNDTWSETGITWNNRPASGNLLATQSGSGSVTEWDVTSQVQTELLGDGKLSVHLSAAQNNGEWVHYYSKEASDFSVRPVLVFSTDQTPPPVGMTNVSPIADSYVRNGTYADTNFGTDAGLTVKIDGGSYTRNTFLRFDLSSIPETIVEATLRLVPLGGGTTPQNTNVEIKFVSDDNWNETGITWNTKPSAGNVLDTKTGSSSVTEWDVTLQAETERSNDGLLSIALESTVIGSQNFITYHSKEALDVSVRPILVIKTLEPSTTTTANLSSEADSYIRSGSYGSDNYGNESALIVKKSNTGDSYSREAYYRFDLSTVSGTITEAKLKLVPSGSSSNIGATNIDVKFVSDDSWNETGITWNNRPTGGSVLSSQAGNASATEWDLTSQAQTEKSGDGQLSLNISATINNGQWVHYYSKEAANASDRPVLVVTTTGGGASNLSMISEDVAVAELPEIEVQGSTTVHPNPFTNWIRIASPNGIRGYRLYSTTGMLLLSMDNIRDNEAEVDTASLTKGVYILEVLNQDGSTSDFKIIK